MSYSVGDVFIGCPASFTGRPYNQPTVLHYASDGITLLDTLTVPVGPALNETYTVQGVAVGADGRCYVVWVTAGSTVPFVNQGAWLGVFAADGTWVGALANVASLFTAPPSSFVNLLALPGGDLGLVTRPDALASTTITRYQPNGTLVNSWMAPLAGYVRGWALQPGTTEFALLLIDDQAYVVSLANGTATGPITVPYDPANESIWGLYASRVAAYLAIKDSAGVDAVWRIQQLSTDLTTPSGARAELATEEFPGGGVFHFGLINPPWDVAVNEDGATGWAVTANDDFSHGGNSADPIHRTDVRSTVIPSGTSSAVQSDLPGDSNLIYVYLGFAGGGPGPTPGIALSPFGSLLG